MQTLRAQLPKHHGIRLQKPLYVFFSGMEPKTTPGPTPPTHQLRLHQGLSRAHVGLTLDAGWAALGSIRPFGLYTDRLHAFIGIVWGGSFSSL